MASKFARSAEFKAPDSVVSYAHALFETKKNDRGVEKYSPTFIFPNAMKTAKLCRFDDGSLKSLEEIVRDVILEQWGEKGIERARAGLIKSPFLAGDGKEARNKETGEIHPGLGPDVFFVRATANADHPPKVSSSPTVFVPATRDDVYSGCRGFPILNAFTWHNDQNGDGVSFGVSMFFKRGDGERIGGSGGGGNPDRWAETVEDTGAAPAATKTGAGAGGLFGD